MATSVYSWDANPAVDRRLYPISNKRAQQEVLAGFSRYILLESGRTAIQRLPPKVIPINCDAMVAAECVGMSALIPFARVLNPMIAPAKLHYEIPHAGDRSVFARHRRSQISVSSRSLFNKQLVPPAVIVAQLAR